MIRVRPVESLEIPELGPYLTLRQQADHFRERLFVAEGPKVVDRLLGSDLEVVSALVTPEHLETYRQRFEARPEWIEVHVAPKERLEHLTGFTLFQGLLACARIPSPVELDVVCGCSVRPRFFVAVDGLGGAENLGGLIRNAAGFGAQALVVGESSVHPYMRRSVRASMGTLFGLPIVEPTSLVQALEELRRRGIRCIGAHPHTERRILPEAGLTGDCCVVLGSEGEGLSAAVREVCDELVAVPMQRGVDSLNVGAAAAVFFYEVWRQRAAVGARGL